VESEYGRTSHASLDDLFASSGDKYPYSPNFGMRALTALVDFDIADRQEDPVLLRAVAWEGVKALS